MIILFSYLLKSHLELKLSFLLSFSDMLTDLSGFFRLGM